MLFIKLFRNATIALFFSMQLACVSTKQVVFKDVVDTTTKKISYQQKKVFTVKELGVYASNDFDGARLNDFYKKNDSTAYAVINPENIPINNSAYYAFKIWAEAEKPFYVEFKYPEGYRHRYLPKIKFNNSWKEIDSLNLYLKDSLATIKLNLKTR